MNPYVITDNNGYSYVVYPTRYDPYVQSRHIGQSSNQYVAEGLGIGAIAGGAIVVIGSILSFGLLAIPK